MSQKNTTKTEQWKAELENAEASSVDILKAKSTDDKMSGILRQDIKYLNEILAVETNFDIIYRIVHIGGREACTILSVLCLLTFGNTFISACLSY